MQGKTEGVKEKEGEEKEGKERERPSEEGVGQAFAGPTISLGGTVGRKGDVTYQHIIGSVSNIEDPEEVARIKAKAGKAKEKALAMKEKMKRKFGKGG